MLKPKLNEHQRKEAAKQLREGESARAIARTFNVHHATVSRRHFAWSAVAYGQTATAADFSFQTTLCVRGGGGMAAAVAGQVLLTTEMAGCSRLV
jgi:Helix-turn-helix domain